MGVRKGSVRYEKEPVRLHVVVDATSYFFLPLSGKGAVEEGSEESEAAREF
jgi:hypothetical protein